MESGLVLAAKYGQSETCKLIIDRCKKHIPNYVIIGWINSSTSRTTALQWSLTSYSSDSWQKMKHKVLETMMVLLQNGALVCLTTSATSRKNSYELAVDKDWNLKQVYSKHISMWKQDNLKHRWNTPKVSMMIVCSNFYKNMLILFELTQMLFCGLSSFSGEFS